MPLYRVTIRYGRPRQHYHVDDVEAPHIADAMRRAADRFPPAALDSGDLVEIRVQTDPERREYVPG